MSAQTQKQMWTRDELKGIMRELVQEVLWEIEQEVPDPDEGLDLSPEFAARLRKAMQEKDKRPLHSPAEVRRRLGLDE